MEELTTHDIITHLTRHGSMSAWTEYENVTSRKMIAAVKAWREKASKEALQRVATELGEAGLDWRTISRVTGLSSEKTRAHVPPVSEDDLTADQHHIKTWGHV